MLGRLALLFILVPLLELYLLIRSGMWLGSGWAVIGLVLITGIGGAALAKAQGLGILQRMRQSLTDGRVPAEGVIDGVFVLVGGLLLLMPGFLTDITGIVLLIPISRRWLKEWLRRKLTHWIETGSVHFYIR